MSDAEVLAAQSKPTAPMAPRASSAPPPARPVERPTAYTAPPPPPLGRWALYALAGLAGIILAIFLFVPVVVALFAAAFANGVVRVGMGRQRGVAALASLASGVVGVVTFFCVAGSMWGKATGREPEPTPTPIATPSPTVAEQAERAAHDARMDAVMAAKEKRELSEAKEAAEAAESRAAFDQLRNDTYQGQIAAEQQPYVGVSDDYSSGRRVNYRSPAGHSRGRVDKRNKVNGGPGRGWHQ